MSPSNQECCSMLQHMSNIQYFFHDREVVQLKLLTKLSMVDQDSALGKQIYMTKTSLPKWNIWIQIQIYVVWKKDVLVVSRTDVIFYASANCEGGMKLKSNVKG